MRTLKIWAAAAAMVALTGTAQATPVFQGRLADGTASSTCTVSGATKCTSFYDSDLDITILNNWNFGSARWINYGSLLGPTAGSAQVLVESVGFAASGLTGWVLPTGDANAPPGPRNQYQSIWNDVGGQAGLGKQFDNVNIHQYYWASTGMPSGTGGLMAEAFRPEGDRLDMQFAFDRFLAVAVRRGDVAIAVPEPQTWALMVAGLLGLLLIKRRMTPPSPKA